MNKHLVTAAVFAPLVAFLAVGACTSSDANNLAAACAAGIGCFDGSIPDGGIPSFDGSIPSFDGSIEVPFDAAVESDAKTATNDTGTADDSATPGDAGPSDSGPLDAGPVDSGVDAADAGPFIVVATNQVGVQQVVVGGGYVYWRDENDDIYKESTGGGAITKVTTATAQTSLIYADATNLYWMSNLGGDIWQQAHSASISTKIASGVQSTPNAMASDGTNLYWTDENLSSLMHVRIGGSTSDAGQLAGNLSFPWGVAAAGGHIYLSESAGSQGTGKIDLLLADGGVQALASNLEGPDKLISDGAHLFWVDDFSSPDMVEGIALDGSARATYVNGSIHPQIATDGVNLYYMEGETDDGTIVYGPVGGGAMQTLYRLEYTAYTLAVDATNVYWGDYNGKIIYKAPKAP